MTNLNNPPHACLVAFPCHVPFRVSPSPAHMFSFNIAQWRACNHQKGQLREGSQRDLRVRPATHQQRALTNANIGGPIADRGASNTIVGGTAVQPWDRNGRADLAVLGWGWRSYLDC